MNRRQRRLAKKQRARLGESAEDRLAQGLALHQAGKLAHAERIFKALLGDASAPAPASTQAQVQAQAQANYYLGMLAERRGDTDGAREKMRAALALDPANPEFLNGLAIALRKSGRLEEAVEVYRQAIEGAPEQLELRLNLGVALLALGRDEQAAGQYRAVLEQDPDFAEAHNNLANLLAAEKQSEAALSHYDRALALNPAYAAAHNNRANLLHDLGHTEEALAGFRRALEIQPRYADANYNLGNTLQRSHRPAEAEKFYRAALAETPDHCDALLNLGNALESLGRVEEAISSYRRVLVHQAGHFRAHSNLLFALLYQADGGDDEIFAEHLAWARRHAPQTASLPALPSAGDPHKMLRIGYVSPDLRRHSVASFIEPVLARHHGQTFRAICYSDAVKPDATTDRLRRMAHDWRDVAGMEDDALARLVRDDGIDILVDLAGHTANHRLLLFARKPAPVQVAYCGYPHSTGLAEMDYRLTDAVCDPPGEADRNHTEKLFRLAPVFLCYAPAAGAPPVGPPPVLDNGYVTFASFNKLAKITPRAMALWSRILEAVPGARLLLKERAFAEESARSDFRARFAAHGIPPERLELLPSVADFCGHLAVYGRADMALDTFPYNGTTTSCEAIWMGVPVVTLAGNHHRGRVGASLLANLDLDDLIAGDEEAYLRAAVNLARDRQRLTALRQELRPAMERAGLTDGAAFTQGLEAAYREMWRRHCARGEG